MYIMGASGKVMASCYPSTRLDSVAVGRVAREIIMECNTIHSIPVSRQ